jgi:hypothetical protein
MFARLDIPPGGVFWTKPELIGSCEADIVANDKGELGQERLQEIAYSIRIAAQNLANAEVGGTC